jgi:murein DD-endopeptidase / murein LD-carboxypeptidase
MKPGKSKEKNKFLYRLFAFALAIFFLSSCGSAKRGEKVKLEKENSSLNSKQKQLLISKYEALIGEKIDAEKSYALYAFIDRWMGTPHCDGGSSKNCTDCSGFVCKVYKEVYKTTLPRSSDDQYKKAEKVKQKHLKEGELVFFNITSKNKISHVGIYLANNKFVHVSSKKGVRIDDLSDPYYEKTFKSGGIIKN